MSRSATSSPVASRSWTGVTEVTELGIVQVSIENKIYNVAVVDPAEYRRFTERRERHAAGPVGPGRGR